MSIALILGLVAVVLGIVAAIRGEGPLTAVGVIVLGLALVVGGLR